MLTIPFAFMFDATVPVRKLSKVVLPLPDGPKIAVTLDSGNTIVIGCRSVLIPLREMDSTLSTRANASPFAPVPELRLNRCERRLEWPSLYVVDWGLSSHSVQFNICETKDETRISLFAHRNQESRVSKCISAALSLSGHDQGQDFQQFLNRNLLLWNKMSNYFWKKLGNRRVEPERRHHFFGFMMQLEFSFQRSYDLFSDPFGIICVWFYVSRF